MVKRQTPRSQGRRRQQPVPSLTVVNPAATQPREAMIAEDAVAEISPAAMMTALEGPPKDAATEPVVTNEFPPRPFDPRGDEHAPAEIRQAVAESDPALPTAASGSMAAPADVPLVVPTTVRKRTSLIPADIAAAGATFQAFLLNEGLAAFAHWRALATVRSPADAVRLHVDEMQRAAEASLTCMGRIASHLGRAAAAA